MNIHQVLSGAGPYDAVTAQAVAYRRLFGLWGWGGRDHAAAIDARVGRAIRPLAALDPDPDDLLLIHYSAYAPKLSALLELPNRKILQYHNVTPAKWFWAHEPGIAVQCSLGRRQLPEFASSVELACAVSQFNAAELQSAGARRTEVVPIVFDHHALPPAESPPAGPPTILFVGRLAPHKRQDQLIGAFAMYRRHRRPDARLVLVGEPLTPAYADGLAQLADDLAPGAVDFRRSLDHVGLAQAYREAHAFVCLSEHEGFCVPLLEAFHFGLPVVARPAGGIPEVAGDAAVLTDDPDLAVVAELMHVAVGDAELRADLRRRGHARLAAYAPDVTAAKLRHAIESVAGNFPTQRDER